MSPRNLYFLACLTLPLAAQSTQPPTLPAAAKAVAVEPGGAKLRYHFLAIGKQIYKCQDGAWSKAATPDATLIQDNEQEIVSHSAGPTWTTLDNKSTMKANAATAIHFPAPDGVSIDWLKLDVDKASRTGDFRDVAIIQRVYTGGGKAPSSSCTAGQVYDSTYTAHYYFWSAE